MKNGRVVIDRYVTLTVERPLKLKSNEDYEETFREAFQNTVTAHDLVTLVLNTIQEEVSVE